MTSADPLEAKLGSKARILLPIFLLSFVAICAWKMWPSPYGVAHRFHGQTMGTTYNITIVGEAITSEQRESLQHRIDQELAGIDSVMSTYNPKAELARFNLHPPGQAFKVDPSLTSLLAVAHQISEQSDGAFDVTVTPLVDLWGFGTKGPVPYKPPAEAIEAAKHTVGYGKLTIDQSAHTLTREPGLQVELSSIAPGYAADHLSQVLLELGHQHTMVEVGGEVFARGHNERGKTWQIGVEQPERTRQALHSLVALDGMGLATSGDYRNISEIEGETFSHTIDPRTGRPVAHNLTSVTVVAQDAAHADAYATAILVLGPEHGLAWANQHDLAAMLLVRQADGSLAEHTTPPFAQLRNLKSP